MTIDMIEPLKQHLRLEADDNSELELLASYIDVATANCNSYMRQELTDVPPPVRAAIILTAAYMYEHREASDKEAFETMLKTNDWLLQPYRDEAKLF